MDSETRFKAFIAAATARSISRAAKTLAMSQPAVSRHIKLLEREVGCDLFRRHGRGIELTDSGQRLFDVLSPALNKIDAVIGEIQLTSGSVAGQLRIASIHTLNSYFVMPVLKNTLANFPALSLQILERSSLDVGLLVERGIVDLGLAYDSMISGENQELVRLHTERMQLFHSCDETNNLSDRLNESGEIQLDSDLTFVAMPAGYALRQMLDRRIGPGQRQVIQVETIALMLEAVRAGLGVCILPEYMPSSLIEDQGLVRMEIAPPEISRTVVAITKQRSEAIPSVSHMIEEFRNAASQLSKS